MAKKAAAKKTAAKKSGKKKTAAKKTAAKKASANRSTRKATTRATRGTAIRDPRSAIPDNLEDYLAKLPADRREVLGTMRALINENLPAGYREAFNWGMISYEVPLERFSETYNGHPLGYVALAAQKDYYALYLMGVYQDPKQRDELSEAFARAGKKLDMGKACLRFRTLDDLPLAAIGRIVGSTPVASLIQQHDAVHSSR